MARLPPWIHGTHDLPEENSGVLIDAYEKRGFSLATTTRTSATTCGASPTTTRTTPGGSPARSATCTRSTCGL
ncbi:MAG: hypothetical protein IPJ34_13070 [Myxococcales bacterium]|nr:hypothetical protein [Myxococcales bacterium]